MKTYGACITIKGLFSNSKRKKHISSNNVSSIFKWRGKVELVASWDWKFNSITLSRQRTFDIPSLDVFPCWESFSSKPKIREMEKDRGCLLTTAACGGMEAVWLVARQGTFDEFPSREAIGNQCLPIWENLFSVKDQKEQVPAFIHSDRHSFRSKKADSLWNTTLANQSQFSSAQIHDRRD